MLIVAQDVLELPLPLEADITPVPNEQWVDQIKVCVMGWLDGGRAVWIWTVRSAPGGGQGK